MGYCLTLAEHDMLTWYSFPVIDEEPPFESSDSEQSEDDNAEQPTQ